MRQDRKNICSKVSNLDHNWDWKCRSRFKISRWEVDYLWGRMQLGPKLCPIIYTILVVVLDFCSCSYPSLVPSIKHGKRGLMICWLFMMEALYNHMRSSTKICDITLPVHIWHPQTWWQWSDTPSCQILPFSLPCNFSCKYTQAIMTI